MPTLSIPLDEREYEIAAQAKREAEARSGTDMTWPEFFVLMANDSSA